MLKDRYGIDIFQVLTNDTEEGSPTEEQEAPMAAALRKRTCALERENRALRDEAARLAAGADSAELAERQLLRDIASQLCKSSTFNPNSFERGCTCSRIRLRLNAMNCE